MCDPNAVILPSQWSYRVQKRDKDTRDTVSSTWFKSCYFKVKKKSYLILLQNQVVYTNKALLLDVLETTEEYVHMLYILSCLRYRLPHTEEIWG